MNLISRSFTAVSLAVVGVMATPPTAAAIGKPTGTSQTGVHVRGGANQRVSLSVLGGYAQTGTRLYWFPDPFDPITGLFAPNRRVAVGPAAVGSGKKLWVAPTNSTTLGIFHPHAELVFGLLLPGKKWLYSSSTVNFAEVTRVPSPLLKANPSPFIPETVYNFYGYERTPNGETADYNDFMFRTSQSTATPEPASLLLLGSGLAGFGGLGAIRRRRS